MNSLMVLAMFHLPGSCPIKCLRLYREHFHCFEQHQLDICLEGFRAKSRRMVKDE